MVETLSSTVQEANFTSTGTASPTLESGKTVISYHGMVAQFEELRIYNFAKINRLQLSTAQTEMRVGDRLPVTLQAFDADQSAKMLDASMVSFHCDNGLLYDDGSITAERPGLYMLYAEYVDYAGNQKTAAIQILVRD